MSISLSSIKKRIPSDRLPPLAIIYGVEGVGKTSLAAEAPNPVFLRTAGEDFPTDIEPNEFPVAQKFSDVIESIGVLANEEHEFRTLVIDALDGLERLVWAETCARCGYATLEDAGFGKGYIAAVDVWKEALDGLTYLRVERKMSVVLLGHTEIVRFDSPTTDPYSRYQINLHKRAADLLKGAADLIGFINFRITLKEKDVGFNKKSTHAEGGGARVIYVEERPGFIAKNRFGMPPAIDFKKGSGWSALAHHIPGASA